MSVTSLVTHDVPVGIAYPTAQGSMYFVAAHLQRVEHLPASAELKHRHAKPVATGGVGPLRRLEVVRRRQRKNDVPLVHPQDELLGRGCGLRGHRRRIM
ncbi:hypothetical protein [Yinghuangia seranimata]|uniref:hypothetical protein n=1 Tax=Yinghuangia seranimata TaxID=408067 RepID=UPI00248D1F13|nr:hypothetical protein [Yinghuangia seranimata]MDI2130539.1 hypothetical protein [Yinghuangia seranimata]